MRLTDYAETTVLKYGKTVSEGIKEMERLIVAKGNNVAESNEGVLLNATEWAHLEALLKKYSKPSVTPATEKPKVVAAATGFETKKLDGEVVRTWNKDKQMYEFKGK